MVLDVERLSVDTIRTLGASAPAGVVFEHFGFTPEAVASRARALLGPGDDH